ncbi:MAG: hypothetical protein ACPHL6_02225 [Rubripirellula sp.]
MNEYRVEELMGQMVGHMTGSMVCLGVWLGDELALYKVMRNQGPQSADEVPLQADVTRGSFANGWMVRLQAALSNLTQKLIAAP